MVIYQCGSINSQSWAWIGEWTRLATGRPGRVHDIHDYGDRQWRKGRSKRARHGFDPPAGATASPDLGELFREAVKDAFFNYNKSDLGPEAKESLLKNAEFLNLHREIRFTIEGHCDERGSEEYNLGLGDRRVASAKKYMVSLGIAEGRIETTSYGKERPFCTEHNEACWRQNHRGHFVMVR